MIALRYPFDGQYPVTQSFDEHIARGLKNYNGGIDWGMPSGTPVLAAADGSIVKVGSDPVGYGNYVKLSHPGGFETLYAHLQQATVTVGRIYKGQQLGLSDNTGNSTGPHLHFELRQSGKPVDPSPFFEAIDLGSDGGETKMIRRMVSVIRDVYIRNGPSTEYLIMGELVAGIYGLQATAMKTMGDDIWIQIGDGLWSAMRCAGFVYLVWLN